MSAQNARASVPVICSPVATLRLLAMADEMRSTIVHEAEQLVLPLEWARLVPAPAAPDPEPAPRPDPQQWGARIVLASFEIMLGRRSAGQLSRLMDAKTLHVLSLHTNRYAIARSAQRSGNPPRPRVTSARAYQPHPDAAEVTAVVHDGHRFRAVAMRLTARGNQWIVTAFEVG